MPTTQPTESTSAALADTLNTHTALLDQIIAELQEIRTILEQNHELLTAEKDQSTTYTD